MSKTFGQTVKDARVKKQWIMQALAEKLKLSSTYIYKIENDETIPNKDTLIELCKALDLNVKKMIELVIDSKVEEYRRQIERRYKI